MTEKPSPRRLTRELVLQSLYASESGDTQSGGSLTEIIKDHKLSEKNVQFAHSLYSLTRQYSDWADEQIARLAEHPKVVAIGEIGLDFYRNYSPRDSQFRTLQWQLDLAAQMDLPVVITFEAGLSFLGLGVRPPTPSWGVILSDGFNFIRLSPWAITWAGLTLIVVTLGFTLFGETLRDVLDPRLSGTRGA